MTYDEIEQVVVDKLFALAAVQKFDAYEVDVPIGEDREYVNGASIPYVLIDFGSKGQQYNSNQGITGTRDDMKVASLVMEVVANNPKVVRQLSRIIRDNFEGYSPDPHWGQFVERVASPLYYVQVSDGGEFYPPRYARSIAYVFDVDA